VDETWSWRIALDAISNREAELGFFQIKKCRRRLNPAARRAHARWQSRASSPIEKLA
jgi:hypothetical protein